MGSVGHNGGPPINTDSGWVAIARAMRDHPLVGFHLHAKPCDPTRGAMQPALAFIDLIMECEWQNNTVVNNGRRMDIKRGQVIGAVSYLAARWNWTPKSVRGWLDRLENDGAIKRLIPGTEKGKHQGKIASVISVCNYDKYQLSINADGLIEGQIKGEYREEKGRQYKEEQETSNNRDMFAVSTALVHEVSRQSINRAAARQGFEQWQDVARRCGLPVPRETSFEVYGRKIAARMFEHADDPKGPAEMSAVWTLALQNVERSSFLRGLTAQNFRADLKFLCQRESFEKLISGGYGNGAHASSEHHQHAKGANYDAIVSRADAEMMRKARPAD